MANLSMDAFSFINEIRTLPTPVPVQRKLRLVAADPLSGADQLVEAVRLDPVAAGRVLRMANSVPTGIPRKIASLRNAVDLLGLPRVRLALLVPRRETGQAVDAAAPRFPLDRFWRHSLAVAHIAESIARHCRRYGAVDEQEAYSAGLLHDCGLLVLAVHQARRLRSSLERGENEKTPFYKAEEPAWSHTAVGALFARRWNFPAELSAVIAGHHAPCLQKGYNGLTAVVHVADVMVHLVGLSNFADETVPLIDGPSLDLIRLPPERLKIIAEAVVDEMKKIGNASGMALSQ
jgi:putative nucleotidyltransferase with HDIG domain